MLPFSVHFGALDWLVLRPAEIDDAQSEGALAAELTGQGSGTLTPLQQQRQRLAQRSSNSSCSGRSSWRGTGDAISWTPGVRCCDTGSYTNMLSTRSTFPATLCIFSMYLDRELQRPEMKVTCTSKTMKCTSVSDAIAQSTVVEGYFQVTYVWTSAH